MRTLAAIAIGVVAGALGLAARAGATELPACRSEGAEVVRAEAPAFSRIGQGIELELLVEVPESVSGLVAVVTSNGGSQVTPLAVVGGKTSVTVPSGSALDLDAEAAVEWDQDDPFRGGPCRGVENFTVPNIPAGVRAGDPAIPRFAGRYRVHAGQGRRAYRDTWTLVPRCAFFGCYSHLKYTRQDFKPLHNGRYWLEWFHGRVQTCEVKYRYGNGPVRTKRIRHAWRFTVEYVVRPRRLTADGVIATFVGEITVSLEPSRYAARWGCPPASRDYFMRGRRL